MILTAWRQTTPRWGAWRRSRSPPASWPVSSPSCCRRRWAEAPWSARLRSATASRRPCWSGSAWVQQGNWLLVELLLYRTTRGDSQRHNRGETTTTGVVFTWTLSKVTNFVVLQLEGRKDSALKAPEWGFLYHLNKTGDILKQKEAQLLLHIFITASTCSTSWCIQCTKCSRTHNMNRASERQSWQNPGVRRSPIRARDFLKHKKYKFTSAWSQSSWS